MGKGVRDDEVVVLRVNRYCLFKKVKAAVCEVMAPQFPQ